MTARRRGTGIPALAAACLCALAVALAHACTTPEAVLELPPVFDCGLARVATEGERCGLAEPCFWIDPLAGGGCCATRATCPAGRLELDTGCDPECTSCVSDDDCVFSLGFCLGGTCAPCPGVGQCPACPAGWVPLRRNGCPSCECAPPSQCDILDPGACPSPNRCYIGTRCAEACDSIDCCVNVCSNADCIPVAPEGCPVPCRANPGCTSCALEACQCLPGGTWACHERCIASSASPPLDCRFPVDTVTVLP